MPNKVVSVTTNHVIRKVVNVEVVNTLEGVHKIHTLILGGSQAGISMQRTSQGHCHVINGFLGEVLVVSNRCYVKLR